MVLLVKVHLCQSTYKLPLLDDEGETDDIDSGIDLSYRHIIKLNGNNCKTTYNSEGDRVRNDSFRTVGLFLDVFFEDGFFEDGLPPLPAPVWPTI